MKMSELFEAVRCSRCGGEGRILTYSNVLGGVCFRCNGAKVTFTARGQRDKDRYQAAVDAATIRPVASVKVGDCVRSENMAKYVEVVAIGEPRRTSWQGEEGTPSYRPSHHVGITLHHAVWHDLRCPLTYKGDKFEAALEGTIRIWPGKENMPDPAGFDSRRPADVAEVAR